jgi:hypothetical protein
MLRSFKRVRFSDLTVLDCDFATLPATQSPSDLLSLYGKFRDYLEHEDDLINSRLTWSLTVHGFLFASYGILLGKIADDFIELQKAGAHVLLEEHIISALFLFQMPVAALGVFIGYSSWRAIIASHNAIQHLVTIAHADGQPLHILEGRKMVPLGSILLPRIIGGGAKIRHGRRNEDRTGSARSYYLRLPALIMWLWMFLASVSLVCGLVSLLYRTAFFSRMGL